MQKFERGSEPPPPGLQLPYVQRSREAMREFMRFGHEKRGQTSAPLIQDTLLDPSIMNGLSRLFRGRCAFCEATDDTRPYRFRPVAEALPFQRTDQGHLYYVWLADAWENIYPICGYCSERDATYFPVRGGRAPLPSDDEIDRYVDEGLGLWRSYPIPENYLLLDPCESKDFYRSFRAQWDGVLTALSPRGHETISTFNLNHPIRVRQRQARYAKYYDRLVEALTTSGSGGSISDLFDFPSLEFGGTWYILLRRLATSLGSNKVPKPILSPARIVRFYSALYGEKRTRERLQQSLWTLQEEDKREPEIAPLRTVRRPGTVRLKEVRLTNFKAIERLRLKMPDERPDSEFSGPAPSLLILGENATGKSSILEAIALTMVDDAAREKLRLIPRSYVLDPSCMGAQNAVAPTSAEVMISMMDGSTRRLTINEARMSAVDDPSFAPLPVFAYGAFRHYQDKGRARAADRAIRNLFDGSLLGNPQAWLLSLDEVRFAMVVRTLRGILSIDGEFEVIERDLVSRRCSVVTATQNRNGDSVLSRTPMGAVSSGFRSVLAMACDVMQGLMDPNVYPGFETFSSARGIVLIDEVEAHLHPRWKMRIMSGLRLALPGMTFIATTHDPLCLRGMGEGEVSVLRRVASVDYQDPNGLPVFVEQVVDLPSTEQLRIEQLLTSDFFQLFSTDEPVFEDRMAVIGDLLVKRRESPLSDLDEKVVSEFQRDIADALPIGSSEAHRLVQEAVALFLKERRTASEARLRKLRDDTRSRILQILRET
ncbi:TPA: AAA family ATPase [Stenotrophomonas maltophilia]